MAKAFAEISAGGEADGLGHHEWLGLLLDREASWRQDKRFAARLRVAKLRQQACVEDVDYRNPRGLDRALFQKLAEGEWINAHDNLALIGPTGVGKSWLASALGHKACRDNRSVLYQRVPRLFEALALARGDGRHPRFCATWAAPICSFSMTGAWSRSTPPPVTISGNPRGTLRTPLHDDYQPAPGRPMARNNRRSDAFMMPPFSIAWCVAGEHEVE